MMLTSALWRFRLLWKHPVHLHVLNITIVSVLLQALYNRLVPSVNGVRRFSPIQISRLRVSTAPKSVAAIMKEGYFMSTRGPCFVGKDAFSPWNNGWIKYSYFRMFTGVCKTAFLTWLSWCPYFKAARWYSMERYSKTQTLHHQCYHHEIAILWNYKHNNFIPS